MAVHDDAPCRGVPGEPLLPVIRREDVFLGQIAIDRRRPLEHDIGQPMVDPGQADVERRGHRRQHHVQVVIVRGGQRILGHRADHDHPVDDVAPRQAAQHLV